jgi:D-arabinose 1-dehydrogenase-like Zn-dependent alcohol dehydrogenase
VNEELDLQESNIRVSHLENSPIRYISNYSKPKEKAGYSLIRVVAGICSTDLQLARDFTSSQGAPGYEFAGTGEETDDIALVGQCIGRVIIAKFDHFSEMEV